MVSEQILSAMAARPDWEEAETSFFYTPSFGETPIRFHDMDIGFLFGIERLSIDVGPDREIYISPCRVVNGCSQHEVRAITLNWDDPTTQQSIKSFEKQAQAMALSGQMGSCLLSGPCSRREVHDWQSSNSPHANIPPWDNISGS